MEIIGILAAFFCIVALVMKKVNLGIAMLTGSIVIGLISPNIGLTQFFYILRKGVFNQVTIELLLVIINITIIANIMQKTGMIDQMIDTMLILFKKFEIILIMIPSVMGVLAIPGGALMSAPMVDSIAQGSNLSKSKKMAINMFFRHVWYFIFPLTPGLILTAGLIGVNIFYLIKYMFPLTLMMGIVGYITLFRGIDYYSMKKTESEDKWKALKELIIVLLPILAGIFLPFIIPIPFWVSLSVGLIILIIYKRSQINLKMIINSIDWKLSLGIIGIMTFKEFINNLDALHQLAIGFINVGIPVWLLTIILPGLIGFITSSVSAAIGISLPLLTPFIGDMPTNMGYIVLMYCSSFFSYYLSPVHFCLILTVDYFGLSIKDAYRELYLPILAGIGTMILLFFIY